LESIIHRGFPVVPSVGNILEEQLDFFAGNNVADVVRSSEPAEGESTEEGAPKKTRPARDKSAKPSRADTRGKGAKTSSPRKAGGS